MNVIPKSRRVVPFPSPPGAHSSTEGKRNGDQPLFIDGLDLAGAAHLAAHLARALQKSKLWAQYTARAHVEQLVFSPAALCSGERSGEHIARSGLGRPLSLTLRVSFIKALVPVVKVQCGLMEAGPRLAERRCSSRHRRSYSLVANLTDWPMRQCVDNTLFLRGLDTCIILDDLLRRPKAYVGDTGSSTVCIPNTAPTVKAQLIVRASMVNDTARILRERCTSTSA